MGFFYFLRAEICDIVLLPFPPYSPTPFFLNARAIALVGVTKQSSFKISSKHVLESLA